MSKEMPAMVYSKLAASGALSQERQRSVSAEHLARDRTLSGSQRKNRILALTFSLPEEVLIEDFSCAVLRTVLLHGRMYISHNYICFYSHFLGLAQQIKVAIVDIASIQRRNSALIIPNAIEMKMVDGTEYFFASFMWRNQCFDLITSLIEEHRLSGDSTDMQEEKSVSSPSSSTLNSPVSKSTSVDNDASESSHHERRPPSHRSLFSDNSSTLEEEDSSLAEADSSAAATVVMASSAQIPTPTQVGPLDEPVSIKSRSSSRIGSPKRSSSAQQCVLLEGPLWTDTSLSDVDEHEFPFSARQFFDYFWSDEPSKFSVIEHLKEVGATQVEVEPWTRFPDGLSVREVRSRVPIKDVPMMSGKDTRTVQTCVAEMSEDETTFRMRCEVSSLDVPFGDGFAVLTSYDVTPNDSGGCTLRTRFGIKFIKSCWGIKSVITSRSSTETASALNAWLVSACRSIQLSPSTTGKKTVQTILSAVGSIDSKDSKATQSKRGQWSYSGLTFTWPVLAGTLAVLLHLILIGSVLLYGRHLLTVANSQAVESRAVSLVLLSALSERDSAHVQVRIKSLHLRAIEYASLLRKHPQHKLALQRRISALTNHIKEWSTQLDLSCTAEGPCKPDQARNDLDEAERLLALLW